VSLPLPEQMTPEQWEHVTQTLIWLWLFVGCMILGAGSMLMAHIVIPSLVETRDIPAKIASVRPVIYGLAAIAFAGAIFVFVSFVRALDEFQQIYPSTWI
jgi:TRAP-type C4-dicarboxylate transport system permease small subunit